jgi:hypothetical protein
MTTYFTCGWILFVEGTGATWKFLRNNVRICVEVNLSEMIGIKNSTYV